MRVTIETKAIKDMRALPPRTRAAILSKIDQYAADPASLANNVKSLQGLDLYRLRVGDYRVIFAIEDGEIRVMVVKRVRHRKEAYD
ncbi:type II toxin-antitoxin system RelE family toxin [Caenispirillum bisanense]|uniref:mRNA interferase RelE/StbE n=1 Tax=Caenispirillum bisanense TaxID=414052 RepID=A0A286GZB5_9PROT|nr:type II toxin-antitoxin system RelE/ParE family toxin [Caenispirillum bisanense]SOE00875.1 mRNA interferase RelE/StbE [Caenispirillum bisanense]